MPAGVKAQKVVGTSVGAAAVPLMVSYPANKGQTVVACWMYMRPAACWSCSLCCPGKSVLPCDKQQICGAMLAQGQSYTFVDGGIGFSIEIAADLRR